MSKVVETMANFRASSDRVIVAVIVARWMVWLIASAGITAPWRKTVVLRLQKETAYGGRYAGQARLALALLDCQPCMTFWALILTVGLDPARLVVANGANLIIEQTQPPKVKA